MTLLLTVPEFTSCIMTGEADGPDQPSEALSASDVVRPADLYHHDHHTPCHNNHTSMCVADLASLLESDSLLLGDAHKMAVQFWASHADDVDVVQELYKPLLDCVLSRNEFYSFSHDESGMDDRVSVSSGVESSDSSMLGAESMLHLPSLALVVFLKEEEMAGEDTWAKMKAHFSKPPWKFHHSEPVARGRLQPYENNLQDYFIAREDLPLCAMRQIHCGKRQLRMLRFISSENWRHNVDLYSLLLGKDPEVLKPDFCLFTASTHNDCDVQLSLKRVPKGIKCRPTNKAVLCFRVTQVGHTVPLLPNVCTPINADRWQTTDLDGNLLYLDVVRMRDRSCEPVPDISGCEYYEHRKRVSFNLTDKKCHVNQHKFELDSHTHSKLVPVLGEDIPKKVVEEEGNHADEIPSRSQKVTGGTGTHGHHDADSELDDSDYLLADLSSDTDRCMLDFEDDRDAYPTVDGSSYNSDDHKAEGKDATPERKCNLGDGSECAGSGRLSAIKSAFLRKPSLTHARYYDVAKELAIIRKIPPIEERTGEIEGSETYKTQTQPKDVESLRKNASTKTAKPLGLQLDPNRLRVRVHDHQPNTLKQGGFRDKPRSRVSVHFNSKAGGVDDSSQMGGQGTDVRFRTRNSNVGDRKIGGSDGCKSQDLHSHGGARHTGGVTVSPGADGIVTQVSSPKSEHREQTRTKANIVRTSKSVRPSPPSYEESKSRSKQFELFNQSAGHDRVQSGCAAPNAQQTRVLSPPPYTNFNHSCDRSQIASIDKIGRKCTPSQKPLGKCNQGNSSFTFTGSTTPRYSGSRLLPSAI